MNSHEKSQPHSHPAQETTVSLSSNHNTASHKMPGYESESSTMGGAPSEQLPPKDSIEPGPYDERPSLNRIPSHGSTNANMYAEPENVVEADSTLLTLFSPFLSVTLPVFKVARPWTVLEILKSGC